MKLQLLHLSDIHFERSSEKFKIEIDKILRVINSVDEKEDADECIVIISGDLVAKGLKEQYNYVSSFLGALFKELEHKKYNKKRIEFVCVPGNHDINFANIGDISIEEINKAYNEQKIEPLVEKYLDGMREFFNFSKHRQCFVDDKIVSKKIIDYGEIRVGFVLVNTAPLSLLGGDATDMGKHFLTEKQMIEIEEATDAEINILVMHHSIEWFTSFCKNKLREIISKNYSLILSGHEHIPVGEIKSINKYGFVHCIQGNALLGKDVDEKGFCIVNINVQENKMVGYSAIWKDSLYVPNEILSNEIKINNGASLRINESFLESINLDGFNGRIEDYYVFPSLTYNTYNDNDEVEKHDIDTEDELMNVFLKNSKIIISGEPKSGKTALSRQLYKSLWRQGYMPVLIAASDINKKKVEKIVEYAFCEQYESADSSFEIFKQTNKDRKILLLDEANLINDRTLDVLLEFFERYFGIIIFFCEDKIDLNIRKRVVDIMVEDESINLTIKPFLYSKRKKLISNILSKCQGIKDDVEKEAKRINEIINGQIKYFNLNPEFIINFVNQYEKDNKFEFQSGSNVFNIVYENTIRNRIISNAEGINTVIVVNILRELAYYMHFGKKSFVNMDEVVEVIERYNETYRQRVSIRCFLNTTIRAKILADMDNEIRFKDHTLLAYFVAQALNSMYHQEVDIKGDVDYLLRNLCFGINSDIILFLSMITNNPKFINIIIEGAKKHFEKHEELCFEKENVSFLLDTTIKIKDNLPNDMDRKDRENAMTKHEENVKFSDFVELVNEYDYSEDDLQKIENQVLISFKYLEIISKTLPEFCHNMRVQQQDELVSLIYKCPNQFLYLILSDIGDNFELFCSEVYQDITTLREEKNIGKVDIDSVKRLIEQISALLVMMLYHIVSTTCSCEQTISALNAFECSNSNYKLQNLMMNSYVMDVSKFSRYAQSLNKQLKNKIEKSIIKFCVREYLLRNNVEIYGDAQSLIDCFFGEESKKKLKAEMAKKRVTDKNRT